MWCIGTPLLYFYGRDYWITNRASLALATLADAREGKLRRENEALQRRLHQMQRLHDQAAPLLVCAVLCHAVLCFAVLCRAMPCRAVLCCALPCHAVPCRAVLCSAMMCCAVLCFDVLCCAVLSSQSVSHALACSQVY